MPYKKATLFRFLVYLVIVVVLAFNIIYSEKYSQYNKFNILSRLDYFIYDTSINLSLNNLNDNNIVILDIDEKSLSEYGRWPWSRKHLKKIIDVLFDKYHVRMLAMDMVFPESETSALLEELRNIEGNDNKSNLNKIMAQIDYDNLFAKSMEGKNVILGHVFLTDKETESSVQSKGLIPSPMLKKSDLAGRIFPATHAVKYTSNLPILEQAAAGGGHINATPDVDGVIRRVMLFYEYDGGYYPSLALAMFHKFLDDNPVKAFYPNDIFGKEASYPESLYLYMDNGFAIVPMDITGSTYISFRGTGGPKGNGFKYISVYDLLSNNTPLDYLNGKIVMMGTTASGLLDTRSAPVNNIFPGVEIHANLLSSMINGTIRQRPSYIIGAEIILLIFVVACFSILSVKIKQPLYILLSMLVLFSIVAGLYFYLWKYQKLILHVSSIIFALVLTYVFGLLLDYFTEIRKKQQMTRLFGQYVPPELVEQMSLNPGSYSMAAQATYLSILFSDIRNFTSLSKDMDPKTLNEFISIFFSEMTDVIGKNRGTVDKYIGDAIMAFWGAPVVDRDHAQHAVVTAMNMQAKLININNIFKSKGWPAIQIGVGINSGPVIVGDMGSNKRLSYTVMGNSVNVASRLESITKDYGLGIIVGETTKNDCSGILFKKIDSIVVRGHDKSMNIYQPLGFEKDVSEKLVEENKMWNTMWEAYRVRDWDRAELVLLNLSHLYPENTYLYRYFQEKILVQRRGAAGGEVAYL